MNKTYADGKQLRKLFKNYQSHMPSFEVEDDEGKCIIVDHKSIDQIIYKDEEGFIDIVPKQKNEVFKCSICTFRDGRPKLFNRSDSLQRHLNTKMHKRRQEAYEREQESLKLEKFNNDLLNEASSLFVEKDSDKMTPTSIMPTNAAPTIGHVPTPTTDVS